MTPIMIKIDIDRADAILDGQSRYGETTVEIDPALLTSDQRDELVQIGGDVLRKRDPSYSTSLGYVTPLTVPTVDRIALALDERRALRLAAEAEKRAQRELWAAEEVERNRERMTVYLDTPVDRLITYTPSIMATNVSLFGSTSGLDDLIAQCRAHYDRANQHAAEVKARVDAEKRTADEARKAKAAKDKADLEAWLAAHLSAAQQRKRAAGLMSDDELAAIVRDNLFAPLDHLPRYERLTVKDFDGYGEAEFGVQDADGVSDEQFATLEAIQQLVPDATITVREHWVDEAGARDKSDHYVSRLAYRVAIPFCGRDYSREYAA